MNSRVNWIQRAMLAGGLACALIFAACTPKAEPIEPHTSSWQPVPVAPPPPPRPPVVQPSLVEHTVIGQSVSGRPIPAEIYGDGAQTILVMATIHGNEQAGTPLVRKLGEYLLANPHVLNGRRVIILPVANPDGMAANQRANSRGVDLNRNFPADNYKATRRHGGRPLSEPESRAIHDLILKYRPDRIISIHQPLACIDYDGPGDGLARALATSSGLPLKKLGSRAGSLGSFAGIELNTPIITVEFARSADNLSAEDMWDRYGRMMLVGICYPKGVPRPSSVITAKGPHDSRVEPAGASGK